MDAKQRYEMWLGSNQVDDVTKQELVNIRIMKRRLKIDFTQTLSLEQVDFEA